jgi:hypothetical protein
MHINRRIFGSKKEEVSKESGEDCIMRNFIICMICQILHLLG